MIPRPPRALSFHAHYRCRHSGDCCTARWPIPVSPTAWNRLARVLGAHVAERRGVDLPESTAPECLPVGAHGCAFHDGASQRCAIHTTLGHDALPVACQQFPRVSILDPRGVAMTLSCFCPTALAMLDEGAPDDRIEIVDGSALATATPDGLDARTSLPPALRPDVLMDWDSWWEFERRAVDLCNRDEPLRAMLTRLSAIVDDVRTWSPGNGELMTRVVVAFEHHGESAHPAPPGTSALRPPGTPDLRHHATPALERRFLACHIFANWTAHLGGGLRTWLRSLETVVFLLEEGWTISEIDLWLRHFADPRRLVAAWRDAEGRETVRTNLKGSYSFDGGSYGS